MTLVKSSQPSRAEPTRVDHYAIVVGAGFSGLGAAWHLKQAGIEDFVILEKANDLGGVWRDNDYPGLAVDVPTHAYSYEFEPWPDFSRIYAPRDEILAYQRHVARKYDIERHLRFNSQLTRATFVERDSAWSVDFADGRRLSCRFLINATGFFTDVKFPEIEGLESFEGKLIHPARWDHGFDLTGRRVSIIGTGATSIQLVPALAPLAQQLNVYQRTPIWAMPKGDRTFTEAERALLQRKPWRLLWKRRWAHLKAQLFWNLGFLRYDRFPGLYAKAGRELESILRAKVKDPALQAKLLPDYTFFCKRPAVSDDYWPTFNRDNVELVTEPIRRITPTGIETQDGRVIEVDVVIAATGYSLYDRWSP